MKQRLIDFVIISRDLLIHMEKIHIDDEHIHVLTNKLKTKSGRVYSESDHNLIYTRLKLTIEIFSY